MSTPGARVNVTTAAKELAGGDRDGATALLRNAGAASIDLGDSNVTTGTGFEFTAGSTLAVDLDPGEIIYGVAASGTVRIDVLRGRQSS